jgi:hypothetical protein
MASRTGMAIEHISSLFVAVSLLFLSFAPFTHHHHHHHHHHHWQNRTF